MDRFYYFGRKHLLAFSSSFLNTTIQVTSLIALNIYYVVYIMAEL